MVDTITDNKLRIMGLYSSNYKASFHVREMAKLLHKNHATLLPHLRALEKDKILTAKMKGKNKVYSLNFSNLLAKEYLTFAEKYRTVQHLQEVFFIKKLSTELLALNLSGSVILFGSYAKRTQKSDSDIDLLCIGDIQPAQIKKIREIGKTYGKTVNVKKTTIKGFEQGLRAKDVLIREVIKHHILLHHSGLFVDVLWRYYYEIS